MSRCGSTAAPACSSTRRPPTRTGRYTSPPLETGSYFVEAVPPSSSGFLVQRYDGIPCPTGTCPVTAGTPVAVTAPSATSNIDFALQSGGTIAGSGHEWGDGRADRGHRGGVLQQRLDEDGVVHYRYAGAVHVAGTECTGMYFVRAMPPTSAGVLGQLYNNRPCPKGVCSVASGTPVSVTAPHATSNINFALEAPGTITGRVTHAAPGHRWRRGGRCSDAQAKVGGATCQRVRGTTRSVGCALGPTSFASTHRPGRGSSRSSTAASRARTESAR